MYAELHCEKGVSYGLQNFTARKACLMACRTSLRERCVLWPAELHCEKGVSYGLQNFTARKVCLMVCRTQCVLVQNGRADTNRLYTQLGLCENSFVKHLYVYTAKNLTTLL
jgi:hypothetical protein